MKPKNKLGQLGLAFSCAGLVALFVLGWARFELFRYMTLCSPFGFVMSIAGLFKPPRKQAFYGAAFGLLGSLFLPTVFLPVLLHRQDASEAPPITSVSVPVLRH